MTMIFCSWKKKKWNGKPNSNCIYWRWDWFPLKIVSKPFRIVSKAAAGRFSEAAKCRKLSRGKTNWSYHVMRWTGSSCHLTRKAFPSRLSSTHRFLSVLSLEIVRHDPRIPDARVSTTALREPSQRRRPMVSMTSWNIKAWQPLWIAKKTVLYAILFKRLFSNPEFWINTSTSVKNDHFICLSLVSHGISVYFWQSQKDIIVNWSQVSDNGCTRFVSHQSRGSST